MSETFGTALTDALENPAPKKTVNVRLPYGARVRAAEEKEKLTQGTKHDGDKNRLELIPPELIFGVGEILTFGAHKYTARNWEEGILWSRVFGALLRHLFAFWSGEDLDPETGKPHLWHAGCCIAFLIAYFDRPDMHQFDDRPTSDPTAKPDED